MFGVRRCQKLFHELGFSLKRAKPIVPKGDELKKEAFKKLQEKLQSDDYEVFYQDEVHFKMTLTIIRAWFLVGTCPEMKSPTDRSR